MTSEPTSRREQILATAAELFAARGFHGVSVADLGAACGVSGPAIYKHFASKDAVLAEMLVSISQELLAVGRERVAAAADAAAALASLVDWHADFALRHRPLIVVQDRDWQSLPSEARERVRTLQREYVDLWAAQLRLVHAGLRPRPGPGHGARGVRPDQLHPAQRAAPRPPDARACSATMALGALGARATRPANRTPLSCADATRADGASWSCWWLAVLGIVGGVATALVTAADRAPGSARTPLHAELRPELRPGSGTPGAPARLRTPSTSTSRGSTCAAPATASWSSATATTARRWPRSWPTTPRRDVRYLRVADSCPTLYAGEFTPVPVPEYAAYLGPYESLAEACRDRMTLAHKGDNVTRLRAGNDIFVKCVCELPASAFPVLGPGLAASAADGIWVRHLQLLLVDFDRLPEEDASPGAFDDRTASAVAGDPVGDRAAAGRRSGQRADLDAAARPVVRHLRY